MSTTIDQRVVEMRFDNKHFEQNVSTTMSTLDKLKQKLHLDGAVKGLDSVNNAAKNVNMSGLGTAVDSVQMKFSALQIMGVTALTNITNSAVNAGKRIVSALTIDPIKTGFSEYETQINATQTILANTQSKGSTIDDVNKALEELNKYADMTIYNFTEMTRNIGTFTAAGIDLDTSVNAIQGIANLAAVSGSTSQQASTAMYQLSQALAAGTIRLMDWNSVVNAGMGGEIFQNALKKTSAELGTGAEAAIEASGSFRESLRDGWLTAEVLTETLKKFTTTGANEYVAEYTGLSVDAVEAALKTAEATYGEADAIEHASKALAEKSGKNADEIADMLNFAKNATDAATKVKTFTQLWDVLKESAQSGWAQTWKIIVGDFEEAKSLLTPLADALTGFINKMSDARNRILEIALDFTKPWTTMMDKLGKVKSVANDIGKVTDKLEYFQDVVNKVWRGDYKNSDTGRFDLLKQAGYNDDVVQDLVNKGYNYKLTIEDIEASHKKFGLTMETTTEEAKETVVAFEELSDQKLKDAGLTEDEIALYRAMEKEANRLGISVSELADEMSKNDGRTMLIDSFKNFGDIFVGIGKAAKEAWFEIFNPPGAEEIAIKLYGVIKSLKDFSETLRLTDKETGKLTENGEKIKSTFEGIFAILDIVRIVVGGPLKIAFDAIVHILSLFDLNILDVTAAIGDAVVGFRDWIKAALDFSKILDPVVNGVVTIVEAWKSWISGLKDSEDLPKEIAGGIAKGFGTAFGVIKDFFKSIPEFFKNGFSELGDSPISGFVDSIRNGLQIAGQTVVELGKIVLEKLNEFLSARGFEEISADSIAGLISGFQSGASDVWDAAVSMVSSLVQRVKEFLGIHSPSTVFAAIGGFIVAGLVMGLQNGVPDSLGAVKDLFQPMLDWIKGLDFGSVMAAVFGIFTMSTGHKVAGALQSIASPFEGLGSVFEGTGEILQSTAKVMSKSVRPIKKILNNTAKVVKSFSKTLDSVAFSIKVDAIKSLVESLLFLVGAIVVLTFFDPAELWNAVGIVTVMALVLVGLAWAMNKMNSSSASISKEGIDIKGLSNGLTGIGIAIMLMAAAVKMMGTMDPEQAKQGFLGLAGLIAAVGIVLVVFGTLVKGKSAQNIDKFGKTMTKLAVALLLMAVVVKILGGMDENVLGQGYTACIGMALILTGLIWATKLMGDSKHVGKIGGTLVKMAVAIGLMAIVAKMLGEMDRATLIQGGIAIIAFGGIIVGLMAATRLLAGRENKNIASVGSTLLKIGVAIGIMGIVVKMLGTMETSEIIRGTLAIVAFGGIIVGLMAATKLISGSKNVEKIGVTLLAISGAIAIMAMTAFMLSMISWEGFAKGTIMITAFAGIMIGLMAATKLLNGSKNVEKIGATLISVAAAIGILALVAVILGLVPVDNLVKGVTVVAILSGLMAGLIAVTKFAKNCLGNLIVLTVAIATLAGAVYLLSTIDDPSKLYGATAAMAVVLGMFALVVASTKNVKNAWQTIGILTLAIGAIGGILYLLSTMPVESVLGSAVALGGLMLIMTGVLAAIGYMGKTAETAWKGALVLATLAVPLAAFGLVLAMMSALKVTDAIPNAIALATLCSVLTLLLIPLSAIGILVSATGGAILLGVVALTAMAVPLVAFVGVLALMSGIQDGIANAEALTALMVAIGDVLFKISLIAPLALIGVGAMGSMLGLLAALGLLATGLGALVTKFPQLQTFLDTGIPILEQLAGGLGSIIGSFITGFAGEVMTLLPQLGIYLSQFMVNVMPFIVGAKMLDADVLAGVGILAGAVLALTAADFISGLFSLGGLGLISLGAELSGFILAAMPFIKTAGTITPDMLSGVKALAETILILTAADLLDGLRLFGGSSLESFASELPLLGQGLSGFSDSLGEFTDEQLATVNCAAKAVKTLAQASSEIPNAGGLLGMLVGENDLGTFAAQFPVLGSGLRGFLDNIGEFTDAQITTVNCAAQAIKTLAQASSEIPNSGGWIAQLVGENDLGTFAAQFPVLGSGLRGFLDNVGTFSEDQVATVDSAAQAIKLLAEASSKIPNSGGWIAQIVGDNDLGTFAEQFPSLGEGIRGFVDNAGELDDTAISAIKAGAEAVSVLAKAATNIPNEGGWISKIVGDNSLGTFASNFPTLGEGIAGFVEKLGTFTEAQVATVKAGVSAVNALAGLANANLSTANTYLTSFGNKLPTFATDLSSFCTNMPSQETVSAASSSIKTLLASVKDIGDANSGCLSTFADNLKKVSKNAVDKFIGAFTSETAKTDIKKAAKTLGEKAVDGVETQEDDMETAGKDLGRGLVRGIEAKWDAAYNAGYTLGQKAVQGEKDGQASNSPSKLTIQAGKWLGEGLVIGMGRMTSRVYNAGYDLGNTAASTISSTISKISDAISTDIDSQPTIRPVMDLSDVRSGTSAISDMLNLGSSIGVSANVNSISSMMNSRNQNGANADVVSAINRLNQKMDNLGNTTYQVNGVTYDDGSNIVDAVKAITRAAVRERRI